MYMYSVHVHVYNFVHKLYRYLRSCVGHMYDFLKHQLKCSAVFYKHRNGIVLTSTHITNE